MLTKINYSDPLISSRSPSAFREFGYQLKLSGLKELLTLSPIIFLFVVSSVFAGDAKVAVASNFYVTAQKLVQEFSTNSHHKVVLSAGSTGKHAAQIMHGAPFDLFLAADGERPELLIKANIGIAETLQTYAIGQLVVWQPSAKNGQELVKELKAGSGYLALANPKLAPYGRAANETLEQLNLWNKTQTKMVMGENITQTFHFVASGNAKLGFIAASQLSGDHQGFFWPVPSDFHSKIEQKMLLLNDTEASRAFYHFLRSEKARHIIRISGYQVP